MTTSAADPEFGEQQAILIRQQIHLFAGAAQLLESQFAAPTLRDLSIRQRGLMRERYEREARQFDREGRLSADEEIWIAQESERSGKAIGVLRQERIRGLAHYAELNRKAIERRDLDLTSDDEAEKLLLACLRRAAAWAAGHDYYGRPVREEINDWKAVWLVTWLVHDMSADQLTDLHCSFRALPWKLRRVACDKEDYSRLLAASGRVAQQVRKSLVMPRSQVQNQDSGAEKAAARGSPPGGCTHAADFNWIVWYGESYAFMPGNQARTVEALWKAWEASGWRDGFGLSSEQIAEEIGSSAGRFRLDDLLRAHPAWGNIIRRTPLGTYALYAPRKAVDSYE